MQAMQDEGCDGPGTQEAPSAERLHEDPDRVELRGPGWAGPIGWSVDFGYLPSETFSIVWNRIDLPVFRFSHPASILVTQGMAIKDFFPPDAFFQTPTGYIIAHGPFLFLRGRLSRPQEPPLRLFDVVLANIEGIPEGMGMGDVEGLLLKEVLNG